MLILLGGASRVIYLDKLVCECGDFRESHEYGSGACRICRWNPVDPDDRCQAFRLARARS